MDFKLRPSGREIDHLHGKHENGGMRGCLRMLGLLMTAVYAPGLAGLLAFAVLDGWQNELFTLWLLWPVLIPSEILGPELFGFRTEWACCGLFWMAMLLYVARFCRNPDQAISGAVILGGLSVLQLGFVLLIAMLFRGVSF